MPKLDLKELPDWTNPMLHSPWLCPRVTKKRVQSCIDRAIFLDTPADPYSKSSTHHASRIAWLVINGWSDPIQIDVGVPSLGACPDWLIQDGNHRLYAALFRGDATIEAEASGSMDLIDELFPSLS